MTKQTLAIGFGIVGGIWGMTVALVLVFRFYMLAFPAWLFLTVLFVVCFLSTVIGIRQSTLTVQQNGYVWLTIASIILLLSYLTRFSIGLFLLPAGIFILFGAIFALVKFSHTQLNPTPSPPIKTFPSGSNDELIAELTDREHEVLDLIALGFSNSQIAEELVISPKTVSNHISNIFKKLQVADRAQAIVLAKDAGLGRLSINTFAKK
jgi:DNA-binding CsgD family transcriptional regulator